MSFRARDQHSRKRGFRMERTLDKLPSSLRRYCIEHDTTKYSPRDHAAWRYIMRRSHAFFKEHAISGYLEGFTKSGLKVDRIPHIDEIDHALQSFGWGAVPVVGFIPPWAFIEFQARRILPIATDMRTVDHIAYTPAPDIVHEAAGHAPILPNARYNEYLAYYASLGAKAIYSKEDLRHYEAVRFLSDIKEKPESSPALIARAEAQLVESTRSFTFVSEQALVARMSWWTAEYGLMGSLKNPKIYGAGLLSSVGEAKLAMTDKVKKIPLSVDCIKYSYDITEPQPQLFVAESMEHLHDVLHDLDRTLSYRVGGVSSLAKAQEAEAITTACLDSELSVSGRLTAYEHEDERIDFIKFSGPVQICWQGRELKGHGSSRHGEGFSSPLGRLAAFPDKPLSHLTEQDLIKMGVVKGQRATLRYISGFEVEGYVLDLFRIRGQLALITFGDCRVQRSGKVYFEPAWGEFDLVIGERIPSVYGGPADRDAFGEQEIGTASTTPGRETPYSREELELFLHYQTLHNLREQQHKTPRSLYELAQHLEDLTKVVLAESPGEWLLLLEIYELAQEHLSPALKASPWVHSLRQALEKPAPDRSELIEAGLRLLA